MSFTYRFSTQILLLVMVFGILTSPGLGAEIGDALPCAVWTSPTNLTFPASGGTNFVVSLTSSTAAPCTWLAISNREWITVAGTAQGTTPGSLRLNISPNPAVSARVGVVEVGRILVHVVQSGASKANPFFDVPANHPFNEYIALLREYGISEGCLNGQYCPEAWTTRADMAEWIVRLLFGETFPFLAQPYFDDVPTTHRQFKYIQKMREVGITSGCGDRTYCPTRNITRGEMAVFIVRAGFGIGEPQANAVPFDDVDRLHIFFPYILKLRETGITQGCTLLRFCASDLVTNGQMAVFLVRLRALVRVALAPTSITLKSGDSRQFNATVTGTINPEVIWSLSPQVGTLSNTGAYQAPSNLSAPVTVQVRAASRVDPENPSVANTTVNPPVIVAPPSVPVTVSVSPLSATVLGGQGQQFTATVSGASNQTVTWNVTPVGMGSITANGWYTAPTNLASAQSVTVRATSVADASKLATASVVVQPVVQVSMSPTSVIVQAGQTQQFAAVVTGTTNTAVSWSVSPAVGSVSAAGLYTAPASLTSSVVVTVRAVSVVDVSKSTASAITVNPTPIPVSVSVNPPSATVQAGQAEQFTATVTGTSNNGVTWTISPQLGQISATGVYSAPATVASSGVVTVRATSVADPTKSATASVTVNPAPVVSVTVNPPSATLQPSQTAQFAASVTGTTNLGIRWELSPSVGSVSATGLYTAPATVASSVTVTVRAVSLADQTKSATANVTVNPAVSVSVNPPSATVQAGQTGQFTATVTGTSNNGVTWTISPQLGQISATGVYSAPATVASSGVVTVRATSVADPTKSATASVTVNPAPVVSVTVNPPSATLQPSQTAQFAASVTGTTNLAIRWELSPSVGSVSATGLYTAPATVASSVTVTVRAISLADQTKSATANVTVNPAVLVSVNPPSATVQAGQAGQFTATITGTSNNGVTWTVSPQLGQINATGLYSAPATVASSAVVTVRATSVADPTKSATANVTVNPASVVSVTVNPPSATLQPGQTAQFAASVTGTTNLGIRWELSPSVGSVSATGLYTAPATVASSVTVTVRAVSLADQTKSATANVAVNPAVSVSVNPPSATVQAGQAGQFTATITGTSNNGVTWTISPQLGQISATGVYSAPATVASSAVVTVRATSVADPTKSATASVTVNSASVVSVTVNPPSATLQPSQTAQFAASVTGTTNLAIRWELSPSVGSVSATGLYTAPATVASSVTVTVRAVSLADQTKSATANVTINSSVSVTVSSTRNSLTPSQIASLTAAVAGSSNSGVTWSLSPQVGSLATSGSTLAVYTAPAIIIGSTQTVEVRATSMADSTKSATVLLSLLPLVTVTVTPSSVTLQTGQSQQFTANVSGAAQSSVVWSVQPAVGTVSASGVYTTPASIAADQAVQVTATSGTVRQSATVVVKKPAAAPTIRFTMGADGLETLLVDGVDRYYKYNSLVAQASYRDVDGTERVVKPTCSSSFAGMIVTHQCSVPGSSFEVVAQFTTPRPDTISARINVINDGPLHLWALTFATMGLQFPQIDSANSRLNGVSIGNPLSWGNYVVGRYGIWIDTPNADTAAKTACSVSAACKHTLTIEDLGPGTTKTRQYSIRFSNDSSLYPPEWIPEAYQSYRSSLPAIIKWPDRRPIMEWFIGEGTKRSALNPRGYFQDPLLDVSKSSLFRERALTAARSVRDRMNSRPVRPQGLIIWDIEGQEFNHATTYIGDPRVFSYGYAPEMNAVVDEIFQIFREAGYRVGVTVRPQYLNWGTTLPSTCRYATTNSLREYFIKVDRGFGEKFYACYDSTGRTWSLVPNSNGSQTSYDRDSAAVLALLRSKIQYARQRWGATLFYVDSAVWVGGEPLSVDIFKALQQEFPDILMIPEQETMDTLAAAIPFTDPRNSSDAKFSPVSWRWVYPEGAMGIQMSDCTGTCWENAKSDFAIGMKIGDIAMYANPGQMNSTQLSNIENLILEARRQNSSVTVTDLITERQYTFIGTPAATHTYPLKMRVYFGTDAADLASSSVYCEAGQRVGSNSCTLNLSGMRLSQVRYYDFTNTHVKNEAAMLLSN